MKFLPPDDPIKLYETGFTDDLLGRKKTSERLSELLEKIEDPLVVAVDGGWGTGKSYFLKRWVAAHTTENNGRALTVYFDAFTHDYLDEPLIGLISALSIRTPANKKTRMRQLKTVAMKLIRPVVRAGLAAATGGASEAVGGVMGAATGAASSEIKEAIDGFWKHEEGRQQAMAHFHEALAHLTESGSSDAQPTPLIIVVDELDRCRPDYALEVLEVIKHFFSVPHVHFVLGVNLRSLGNSVKARYGPSIDSSAYLQKFLSLTLTLPNHIGNHEKTSSTLHYLTEVGKKMGIGQEVLAELERQTIILLKRNSISIRDAGKILSTASLLPDEANQAAYILRALAVTLLISKVIRPDMYQKLLDATASEAELITYLGIEDKHRADRTPEGDYNPDYDHKLTVLFTAWAHVLHNGELPPGQYVTPVHEELINICRRNPASGVPHRLNDIWLNTFRLS